MIAGRPGMNASVAIVGMHDDTRIRAYNLNNGTMVSNTTIDAMQTHYVIFANGTAFKVETSKLACVLLLNYGSVPLRNATSGPLPATFYQDTSGAYVGKEFVLMASDLNTTYTHIIFALENADVRVTREDGYQQNYTIKVNAYKELTWNTFRMYKIESTGNIMIQSGRPADVNAWPKTFFVPAVGGGFLGNTFYTWSTLSWDRVESYGFRVSASQDTKIKVISLETRAPIFTADVQGGSGVGFKPNAPAVVVQSDKPVTLEYIHNGSIDASAGAGIYSAYGSGVGFFGARPYEDTPFFLPVDSYDQAFIFASEDTQVMVDGEIRTIKADSYYLVTGPGTHIINSNIKVVVETLNWPSIPDYQGLQYDGSQIPSVQTVDVVTNVKLTPLGESFPIMYLTIAAVAAGISVIVVFLFLKGRGKK
jgi:hypothetical protein